MSVWINHDCIVCGHRFMHDVNKACICEHCTEFSKSVESRISQLERQLAEAKADSERLDWLIEGKWEVYPSGRKYCIAHDIYDAVYGPDLRQAIDNAMKGQDDEANTGRNLEAERTER